MFLQLADITAYAGYQHLLRHEGKEFSWPLGVQSSRTLEAAVNNAWNKVVVLVAAAK
ncbi:hypothetical protein [Pseudarthrobacter sp. NamE2]|uniref:hypothetical protein n=1 Tax=Pseudarthrobacter sp. NamE2 TaxID=2576838 RepID=UPI0014852B69|nr:hypothetical protein [Pseudarthrobacter sp. NamE2]